MKINRNLSIRGLAVAMLALSCAGTGSTAIAGNEANFVLYSHHTEPAGELEINAFNDYSRNTKGLPKYNAQLIEIEYAFSSKLTSALYFEGQKTNGVDYQFGGLRWETRYRPFEYGTFLNPVLYVEYEHNRPDHRYLLEVVGRTDTPERPGPARTEHSVETKLILGHDFSRNLNFAFNWINEANLDTGHWEFGYATGLNMTVYRAQSGSLGAFDLKRLKIGAEMFGGLGDSTLGLTANAHNTQQYAGLNVYGAFGNGMQVRLGAATGLTDQSERFIGRLMVGFEMK